MAAPRRTEGHRVAASLLAQTLAAALALAVWPPAVSAQEGLYGPQAPTDVAYVRAVNAVDVGGLGVRVGDAALEALAFGDATGYVAVPPGPVRIDLGGEALEIEAAVGAFLTAVAGPDRIWLIEDTPLRDASRGLLALYNLSDRASLDLVVVDGPPVAEGVSPGEQRAVAVAEAEVALRVRTDAGEEIDLDVRIYERGVAHAVIVVGGAEGLVVTYVASRLDD